MSFKEYFKLLLDGKPDDFIEEYFSNPYPERYREFEKQEMELYESDVELTDEMQDALDEIDDVDGGYGDVEDI